MRSKKTTTYILLLLSIGIWCTVAYRVYAAFKDNKVPVSQPLVKFPKKIETDSVALLLNYRDPFLNGYFSEHHNAKVTIQKIKEPKQSFTPQHEVTPDFQFKGIIRLGGKAQAIVTRNGESAMLKSGEKIGEFRIIEITENKLVFTRKGKSYDLSPQ